MTTQSAGSVGPKSFTFTDAEGQESSFTIIDAIAYIDTVALLCPWRLSKHWLIHLRKSYGECMIVKNVEAVGFKQFLILHQPKPEDIGALRDYFKDLILVVQVDIAFDFITATANEADLALTFLARHVLQKWRGQRLRNASDNVQYWSTDAATSRNIRLYSDRPSKSGLGHTAHFELSFRSAAACRAAGLDRPDDLPSDFDPLTPLTHQTRLVRIDRPRFLRCVRRAGMRVQGQKQHRRLNLEQAEKLAMRFRWAVIMDRDGIPTLSSLERVQAQEVYDRLRSFRSSLVPLMTWEEFSPAVRWLVYVDHHE